MSALPAGPRPAPDASPTTSLPAAQPPLAAAADARARRAGRHAGRAASAALAALVLGVVAALGLGLAVDRPADAGVSLAVAADGDAAAVVVGNGARAAFDGRLVVAGHETAIRVAPGTSRTVLVTVPDGCRGTFEVRLAGDGAPGQPVAVPCSPGSTR